MTPRCRADLRRAADGARVLVGSLILLALPVAAFAAEGEGSPNIPKAVNFTILAAILIYLLGKPVGNLLNAKANQIREGLEAARGDRAAAAEARALAERREASRDADAEAARDRIRESAVAEGQRIIAVAEEQARKLTAAAEAEIQAEVRAAERRLAASAAQAAVRVARKRLATMSDEDHDRLVQAGIQAIRSGS